MFVTHAPLRLPSPLAGPPWQLWEAQLESVPHGLPYVFGAQQ
jgi:hypothetical protein